MKRLLFLLALLANFSLYSYSPDVQKLTLSASAALSKKADELQMKIGVVNIGDTAEAALAENSRKMRDCIANLHAAGLTTDDYETSHFSINPIYTPHPQNPPPNWRQSIIGYEVNNTILLHTPKLSLAGIVIDAASEAGANTITDIRFTLHNPRIYWNEALAAASSNAVSDAQTIAAATGVRLIRVLSINLNHTQVRSPQPPIACFNKMAGGSAPPIEPGEVTLEASVTLVYEIQ